MIDGHCHLDKRLGAPEKAFRSLYDEAHKFGIQSILLLNLPELAFENADVLKLAKEYQGFFHVFPGINPKSQGDWHLLELYEKAGAKGIKLHPRLHEYSVECSECVKILQHAGALGLPVLIDCFPDGKNISLGNLPGSFGRVAEKVNKTKIAIGHAGGHHILDAMMVAKQFPNIYLDLSFTLLYYRHLPLIKDIEYALRCMKYKKVFWGTDYPDRVYEDSVKLSCIEFKKMQIPNESLSLLLHENVLFFLESDIEPQRRLIDLQKNP